VRQP
jgi:hypothetical protein